MPMRGVRMLGVAGLALLALAPAARGAEDQAAPLFEPTKVAEIDLGLPQASRDALASDPDEYQDGTFTMRSGGQTYGPLAVGVRLKGGSTFRGLDAKAAFKVKFAHSVRGQRLLGLKTLTLNNMVADGSMVHETLAYEAFRAAGVPAPRTGYAYVKVDGDDYGLYLNLETPDDVSLPRWFASTEHLYEGEHGSDVVPGGAGTFEVDEGDEGDLSDLEALIAAVHGSGPYTERMATVADLDEFVRMWAVERYIGHFDSYTSFKSSYQPSNYYLHSDEAGRFTMMPWSTDGAWQQALPFDAEGGGVMFNLCLADSACAGRYREAVRALPGVLAPLRLGSRATEIAEAIAPWQAQDPRKEWTAQQEAAQLRWTRNFIARRPAQVEDWLAPRRAGGRSPRVSTTADRIPALSMRLSLRTRHRLRRALLRGLRARVLCSRACRVRARALLPRRGRRALEVGRGSLRPFASQSRGFRVRFSRRGRRALARRRRARLVIVVRVTDALGRSIRARRAVRLTRER